MTHACVGSDVQCKITWYPGVPVDQLVAVELRKPVIVPVPSVPLDAFVLEKLLIRTPIAPGPTRMTLSDLDAGWHQNAIGHITAVRQIWVIAGPAIGRNVGR